MIARIAAGVAVLLACASLLGLALGRPTYQLHVDWDDEETR